MSATNKMEKTVMHRRSKLRKQTFDISRNKVDLSRVTRRIDFDDDLPSLKSDRLDSFVPPSLPAQSRPNPAFDSLMNFPPLDVVHNSESLNSKELLNGNLEDSSYSTPISRNQSNIHTPRSSRDISDETFVPAKDFFSDSFTREKITSDYFSETDTPIRLRESTKRLRIRKPLNEYIAYSSDEELEEWWKQPKTDYTYSASMSYRERVTPERSIGSPNMSRKGLRGGHIDTMASPPFNSRLELPTNSADNLALRSRKIPRAGLSSYSDESDVEESQVVRSSQSSFVKRYKTVSLATQSQSQGSQSVVSSTSTSNNLRYGLDLDSDADDSPSSQIARPIVRKGVTSLLRKVNPATTSAVDSESYSNSINGRYTRMGNHVRTSSVTSLTETTEIDATNSYYKNKFYTLQSSKWKDVFRKSSNYIYTKVTNFLSLICVHVILWSTQLFNFVQNKFSRRSSKRSPYYSKTRNYVNEKLTTTTVLSRRQTVLTYIESTYSWYENRRKKRPFLWCWLPLLLLLLLIPFFLYFRGATDQENASLESSHHWLHESSSVLRSGLSFLSQKLFVVFTVISEMAFKALDFLKYLMILVYDAFVMLFSDVFNLASSYVSSFVSLFKSPTSITDEESRTSKSYSSVTVLSTCWTYLSEGTRYAGNSVGLFIIKIWTLGMDGLLSLWYGLLWIIFYIWSFLSSISSGLLGYLSIMTTEIMKLPYKAFTLIPFTTKTSTQSNAKPYVYVQHSSASVQPNSEELLQQIILNPAFHGLISSSIADRESALREKLVSEVRDNLESDIQKLKAELVPTQKQFEEFASRSEILSLRLQLDNLMEKFTGMENMLNGVLNKQEKDQGSVEYIEEMKMIMDDMSVNIAKLNLEIENLQNNHTTFEAKLRSCCQNTSVTIEQVRGHMKVLLSDLIGLNSAEGEEWLSLGLKEWVGRYFVAKEELETKLNNLVIKMETNSQDALQETLSQTVEQVMNSVLDQIRSEMKVEYERLQDDITRNKDDSDKEQSEIRSMVEESMIGNREDLLFQFVESLSSDQIDADLQNRILDALKPLVAVTVEKKLDDDLTSVVDEKVSQAVEEHVLNAELKMVQMKQEHDINLHRNFSFSLNDSDVEKIVKTALLKYDADKTGMVDHALESGGGSIISTRCTEGYQGHQAELTIFGYPVYRYSTNTPRSIIQPERNPGQCYAFKGSQGFIVIQFAGPVRISAITLEHIPKILTPSGTIDSAPKEFSVYGLQTTGEEGFHFGKFVYKEDGEPLQYFPVHNFTDEYFKYVELKIHSNHGNMHYTCIYRFRVHGIRKDFLL